MYNNNDMAIIFVSDPITIQVCTDACTSIHTYRHVLLYMQGNLTYIETIDKIT
jgi:hypothetical protein